MLVVVARGLVAVPGIGPQRFGLRRSGRGSNGVFSVLRWRPCPHCTGIIASIKLSLLPALRRHCCQVGLQRSGQCSAGICQRCTGILPASRWRHCQHRAVIVVAGIALVSSPLACRRLCPHCALLVVTFALPPSLPYVASSPYPVSLMPHPLFSVV